MRARVSKNGVTTAPRPLTEGSLLGAPQPDSESTVSLVIPARNEARNIAWVLNRVPQCVDEVILVDGSSDNTADVAREIRPDIVVVDDLARGKGAALRAGFEAATQDHIVMIDADGSMDPQEVPRYVSLLDDGFDLVKGSRQIEGGGSDDITWFRRFGNDGLRILANRLYSARFTDFCYGYMAFQRRHLAAIAPDADGFDIEAELILKAKRLGLSITEVPTYELPRRYGDSNLNAIRDGVKILRRILRERRMEHARVVHSHDPVLGDYGMGPEPMLSGESATADSTKDN